MNTFVRVVLPLAIIFGVVGGVTYLTQLAPPPPPAVVKAAPGSARDANVPPLVVANHRAVWDPQQPNYAREFELNSEGNYDFWVANRRNEPTVISLRSKSCQCADVEMSVIDADKVYSMCRSVALLSPATRLFGGQGFDPLGLFLLPVIDKIERKQLVPLEGTFTVPPADPRLGLRLAVFRMFFRAKDPGPQRLTAEIHAIGSDMIPVSTVFEALKVNVPPVLLYPRIVSLGDIKAGDVRRQELVIWSSTRSEIPVDLPPLADDPCFEFTTPVRLTEAERASLVSSMPANFPMSRPRVAYRVGLTVHESRDGKQLDLGPLNRKLKFNIGSEFEAESEVTGTVRGDVAIMGDRGDEDKIRLGEFYSDQPWSKRVQIRAATPGLKLKYLSVSPPELKVTLTEKPSHWLLQVDVPANTVVGNLPQGSHVLLETSASPPRRVRLPLDGAGLIR